MQLITNEFRSLFDVGFNAYINRNWKEAKEAFEAAQIVYVQFKRSNGILVEPDIPIGILLEYMNVYDYECPNIWQGYRKI